MQTRPRFVEHVKRLATLWTLQFGGEGAALHRPIAPWPPVRAGCI
jgi:hypothetical protein